MVGIFSNVFQIIVLATGSNALLRVGSPFQGSEGGGRVDLTQENGLELVHTGVGEEERGVTEGGATRRGLIGVFLRGEVVDKGRPDPGGWPVQRSRSVWRRAHEARRAGNGKGPPFGREWHRDKSSGALAGRNDDCSQRCCHDEEGWRNEEFHGMEMNGTRKAFWRFSVRPGCKNAFQREQWRLFSLDHQ